MKLLIAVATVLIMTLVLILTRQTRQRNDIPVRSMATAGVTNDTTSGSENWPSEVAQTGRTAFPATASPPSTLVPVSGSNWLESLFTQDGELPPLPREAVEGWLASGRTNAQDLLALRQAGGGTEFLFTALANFPNDPRVLMAATALNDGPERQRERLDRFKAAAPDNALANYLSARDHLKNNRPEQALADLEAAATKPRFDDYVLDSMQNTEELYLQAGRTPAEAKALGTSTALLPHLVQLKGLAQDIATLQGQYLAAGDPDSAGQLAKLGVQLGDRLSGSEGATPLISQLVGIAVEQIVLTQLDPDQPYEFLHGTPNDYVSQLKARKDATRENSQHFEQWMRNASEAEIISYFDRLKLYGETEAMKWMRQRLSGR